MGLRSKLIPADRAPDISKQPYLLIKPCLLQIFRGNQREK